MTTQNTPVTQAPAPQKPKGVVTYQVAGQDVTLSYQIVRDFLTKGNGAVSDQDLTQFISICKYQQLNPFLNEAYLVKFGDKPAQMIVSKEAMFKRAEAHESYEGYKAGIIVKRGDEIMELQGNFKLPEDILLGGWAEVHRSDRKFPIVAKVTLGEYDKKQSTWNEKPLTMISKIAKVQALREAFPAQLGAVYTQEEQTDVVDVPHETVKSEIKKNANKEFIDIEVENPKPNDNVPADGQQQPNGELFNDQGPDY